MTLEQLTEQIKQHNIDATEYYEEGSLATAFEELIDLLVCIKNVITRKFEGTQTSDEILDALKAVLVNPTEY